MKRKIIFISLIVLLVLVAAVSLFQIIRISLDYKKADDVYEDLQSKYVGTVAPETTETGPGQTEPDADDTAGESSSDNKSNPIDISVDFASLIADNSDVVGWLYCPDTLINYPVVQGEDNDKYLRADLDGNYLVSGTLFVDYRNGLVGEDRNYIIYGHNMKNGTMFGSLLKYKEQSYYDAHPEIYYLTPDGYYAIQLVTGLVVSKTEMIYQANPDSEEFRDYLSNAVRKSTFQSDAEITDADNLIVLSTCSYEYDSARYVVIGKLAPIGGLVANS